MTHRALYSLAVLLLLTACAGRRKMIVTDTPVPTATFSAERHIAKVQSLNYSGKNLTSKVNVRVSMGGRNVSTSGTLRMRRDDVIQLSLVDPILGITEVGRMEFSPDRVLIIDRINRQYIDVPYSDVSFLSRAGINFDMLQSMFWNELFDPASPSTSRSSLSSSRFTFKPEGSTVDLTLDHRQLHYTFQTDAADGRLLQTSVSTKLDSTAHFAFDYGTFQSFENSRFPQQMDMSFQLGNRTASLSLRLSSLKASSDWQAHTTPPSRYTHADAEQIFKSLVK